MHTDPRYSLLNPIELARTAPFGSLLTLVNVFPIGTIIHDAVAAHAYGLSLMALPNIIVMVLVAWKTVGRQIRFRHKLERRLQSGELDDDYLRRTTTHWCDRQTARTVLRRDKQLLERYKLICVEEKDVDMLTWLPHI